MNIRITQELVTAEYMDWIRNYGNGRGKNDLRFGQYIFNLYGTGSLPEVYYEESANNAYTKIIEHLNGK